MRLRSGRTRISSEIYSLVKPQVSDNTVRERIDTVLEGDRDTLFLLNKSLDTQDSAQTAHNANLDTTKKADESNEGSEQSDDDSDLDPCEDPVTQLGAEAAEDLLRLRATAKFLTSGKPFPTYKQNLRKFLNPEAGPSGNMKDDAGKRPNIAAVTTNTEKFSPDRVGDNAESLQLTSCRIIKEPGQPLRLSARSNRYPSLTGTVSWLSRLRRMMRPKTQPGYRRVEWRCVR